jgi:site-specific DNA-methyltransferase (cytosine-N4-specific)
LIAIPNTESNSYYLRYCEEHDIKPHPARYPAPLPEFFIRMLTDEGDAVIDPFAGSCVTGEVCERLRRKWVCVEMLEEYLKGGLGRFERPARMEQENLFDIGAGVAQSYKIFHPAILSNGREDPLPTDGGKKRVISKR